MARKIRKRLVGHQEDADRRERETEYAELEQELHAAWQVQTTEDPNAGTVSDVSPAEK